MGRKRHSTEEIVDELRQTDVELGRATTVAGACKLLCVTEATYFRGRRG